MENEYKSEFRSGTGNERGDIAKEKIVLFVVGVLIGAVISTVAFFVYVKTLGINTSSNNSQSSEMQQGGTPPEMPSGNNSGSSNN